LAVSSDWPYCSGRAGYGQSGHDDVANKPQYLVVDAAHTTPIFEPRDAHGNDSFFPLGIRLTSFQNEAEAATAKQVAKVQGIDYPVA
jgi:hypothetical protein